MKVLVLGRGYIGKALSVYEEFDVVSHSQLLRVPALVDGYDAVVNAAGIIGHRQCEAAGYDAVIAANVEYPLKVQAVCERADILFFQLTTVGISKAQVAPSRDIVFREGDPVYPHNLYCASKLLLEASLKGGIVLRMPWVVATGVFQSRVKNWQAVQDTYTSILTIEDLRTSILALMSESQLCSGLFHLKSADVYFPDFINQLLSLDLPLRKEYPRDMTAAVPIAATYESSVCPTCFHRHNEKESCLD